MEIFSIACAALLASAPCARAQAPAAPERPTLDRSLTLDEASFVDSRYLVRTLADLGPGRAHVLAFLAPDCPLARRSLGVLAELERATRERGARFVGLDPSHGASVVELAAVGVGAGAEFPFGLDEGGALARRLGVERTPTVCVLDARGRLAYHGRVDGALRLGGDVVAGARADLREALEDVLAGRAVRVAETRVDGCLLTFDAPRPAAAQDDPRATWTGSIGELVRARCGACHQPGGAAPFALWTWRDAARRGDRLAEVVRRGQMPPWHASRSAGAFVNERRLSDDERERLLAWLAAGCPPGDLEARPDPEPPRDADGWRIDEPDLVLAQAGRTELPATGTVPYRYVVLPHVFARDTWVEAVEIRPENPRVVHHANLGWVRFGSEFSPDNFLTGYVPGGDVYRLEPGQAYRVPAGAVLGLQVHYVTVGEPASDRLRVGLRFPRAKVEQRARHLEIANKRFSIPPRAPAETVAATRAFDGAATGIGMFVHMHLRGRDVDVRHLTDDGGETPLLLVPNYDFDWQSSYRWAPGTQRFAAGDRVRATARFDNSPFNPFNPDPDARVRVGQETTDEMMYVFLFYTLDDERLGLDVDPATGAAR